jgi:hypothetical protein
MVISVVLWGGNYLFRLSIIPRQIFEHKSITKKTLYSQSLKIRKLFFTNFFSSLLFWCMPNAGQFKNLAHTEKLNQNTKKNLF